MTTLTMDNRVKQVVSNIRNLPTPPVVFHQIQKVLNDPKVSAAHVAAILAEDPAMSVKVLKMTNSAFYGLSREIDSVKQAVVIIGMEAIRNLVLSASVLDMFKGKSNDQEFQEKFWRHSLATAFCSRILARKIHSRGIVDPDAAFSGGLLHDIGKVVLNCFLRPEYEKYVDQRAIDKTEESCVVEEKALGYTHSQIGSLLAVQWKLPQTLGETITFHHYPDEHPTHEAMCYLVHLGNYIAKRTFYEREERNLVGNLRPGVLEHLALTDADLDSFSDLLREEYLKSETFMSMIGLA